MDDLGTPSPEQREAWKRHCDYVEGYRAVLEKHRDPMDTWLALKAYDEKWAREHPCPA